MEPSEYLDLMVVDHPQQNNILFKRGVKAGTFSIIIPVKNDVQGLSVTLYSIKEQNVMLCDDFEVIVCCDGGSPQVADLCRESSAAYITGPGFGSYSARNAGISASTGEYLVFIDADVTICSNWLNCLKMIREVGIWDYCGGPIEHKVNHRNSSITEIYLGFAEFPCEHLADKYHFFPTGNMVVKRSIVERFGGFDFRLRGSGDLEFGQRLFNNNIFGKYLADLKVYHPCRSYQQLLNKLHRQVIADRSLYHFYPDRYPSLGARDRYIQAIKSIFAMRTLLKMLAKETKRRGVLEVLLLIVYSKYISFRRALISIKIS